MNFLILLLICVSTCFSGTVSDTVKFSPEDARVRRDSIKYSSSVIHQNPKYPDQRAESSVNVDFHTNYPQSRNVARKRPKTSSDQVPLQQTYGSQKVRHQQDNRNQYNSPQSQSFNVGYSVRFNGRPQKSPQQTFPTAEIITGSRNEAVQRPSDDFDAQEFVNNALIDIKKQKISGIKPKYHKYNTKDESKHFIANLAPKTQEYLSYLGDSKPIVSSNPRFRQQLLPKVVPTTESLTSSWTSLTPTIEIYHSKDLLQNTIKQSTRHFDHVGALGKSQGFDYSNVVDALNNNKGLYDNLKTTEQAHPFIENDKETISYKPLPILPVQQIQLSQTPSESIQIRNVQKPNLPVDVRLLRDPVLTVSSKNVAADQHTLPIPYDTTLIHAMQQKLNSNQNININDHNQIFRNGKIAENHIGNVQTSMLAGMHHIHLNGNPQPALVLNNENFDQYFNRYLETIQPQETRAENVVVPFQGINFNNGAKDIEMDLRPPPIDIHRSSRLFVG